jgi:transglutaminase-like putative cysteine protease
MREANWDEIFQRREDRTVTEDERFTSVLPWESWLTFGILAVMFMSVVHSIDSANWVDDMPSLYPIGFAGLVMGYALSRVRWNELVLHGVALLGGATLIYLQLIAIVPGGSISDRTDGLLDRMYTWWSAATQDGISNDSLPFIVMVLTMVWLGSYLSAWSVFRWRNAWVALIPGGTALMWNISFIPGQFSYAIVVFIFGAVLLLMRLHVARRQDEWEQHNVTYPEFLSLSVLHATFWVTVLLLILVFALPRAERSDSAHERWSNFTAPLTERLTPLGRVFIGVNAKRPINVHNLEDALAFQGKIKLSGRDAVEVNVELTPQMAAFLRSQSFDEYTSDGWKVNIEGDVPLAPGDRTAAPDADEIGARQEVTINVTVKGNNDDFLYSVGQPVQSDQAADANVGDDGTDIQSLRPDGRLRDGDTYTVTGSVNIASVEQLQTAGDDYPAWVEERYTALPDNLPDRVGRKAREVSGSASTPYDQALAIERYLRTFPNDYNVPSTPPGRDSVDYFLFDVQRGYFDYHASAMAVMLRTLGIPARVATGYVVDPLQRDADTTKYRLTERNAFAWPEVYFPGIGWVEFSPTPSQPVINRLGAAPDRPQEPREDQDPNLRPEEPIDLGINPDNAPPEADTPAASDGGSGAWPAIITLAVLGALGALIIGGGRLAWEYGLGGLPRPAQLWEKTQRLARWGNHGSRPSETPREFARRLRTDVPGTENATYLAAAYERTRFGQKKLSEDETERLELAYSSVRNQLLRRVLRLKPRADA